MDLSVSPSRLALVQVFPCFQNPSFCLLLAVDGESGLQVARNIHHVRFADPVDGLYSPIQCQRTTLKAEMLYFCQSRF